MSSASHIPESAILSNLHAKSLIFIDLTDCSASKTCRMSSRVILGRELSNIVQFPDLGGFKN